MVITATYVESEDFDRGTPRPEDTAGPDSDSKDPRIGREGWRTVASSVVVICFAVLTAAGLVPESETSAKVNQIFGTPIGETGLRQNWGVFSPDPLQVEVRLKAVVYFDDGSLVEWSPPTDNVFDTSRSERWRKWESRVRQDAYEAHWPVAAEFIASEFASEPSGVIKVRLVRTWTHVPLPPEPSGDRQVEQFQFYEWDHLTSTGTELGQADQRLTGVSS